MKKKISGISLIIVLALVIINKNDINRAIIFSINLWLDKLLPTIYPSVIIGKTLVNLKFYEIFFKKYNIIGLLILAIILGSPTSQIIFSNSYQKKIINQETYYKLVITTSLINPFFFFAMTSFLSIRIRLIILITNYLLTLILWIKYQIPLTIKNDTKNNQEAILTIVIESFKSMINILAIIICFNIVLGIITKYLNNAIINLILVNLEITNGYYYLSTIKLKTTILVFITSFLTSNMGLAINLQIKSIINDSYLYNTYFKVNTIKSLALALITSMLT